MIRETLAPGEQITQGAQGQYVYLRKAAAPVYVTVHMMDGRSSSYELTHQEQVELLDEIREVTVRNLSSGSNDIEIVTGYGRFHPRRDGQEVIISGQAGRLDVDVPDGVTVKTPAGVPLEIVSLFSVEVVTDPSAPLDVVLTGSGTTAAQPLHVTGPGATAAAPVHVTGPGATAAAPAHVKTAVPALLSALAPVQPAAGAVIAAAESARREIIIRASADNVGPVWIGPAVGQGLPLSPGDEIRLATTAEISAAAGDPADTVYLLEIKDA